MAPVVGALIAQLHNRLADNGAEEGAAACGFQSPLSIFYAMMLALNAAGPDSSTHAELLELLGRSTSERLLNELAATLLSQLMSHGDGAGSAGDLLVANSIWTKTVEVVPAYTVAMSDLFQAMSHKANSAADINAWAAEATRGLIEEAVPPGMPFDAVLVNAVYFKGKWQHAFDKDLTHDVPFTTTSNAVKNVPMMHRLFKAHGQGDKPILTLTDDGMYQGARLPYQGDVFSAIALLPEPGKSASDLAANLDMHQIAGSSAWTVPHHNLRIALPRFKVHQQLKLTASLKRAGIQAAFSDLADFSRMSETRLKISDVVHTAVVEVNEEGTEAAATTAIMMVRMCMPLDPEELVFDRPFVFVLVHDPTSTPMFVGVVDDL